MTGHPSKEALVEQEHAHYSTTTSCNIPEGSPDRENPCSPRRCSVATFGSSLLMLVVVLLVILFPATTTETAPTSKASYYSDDSPTFDFYVMAMSWQPQFCYYHRYENYPGCDNPNTYWKTHWTIHGLWPQYADGSYPSSCSAERLNSTVVNSLSSELDLYWPNVKASSSDSSSSSSSSSSAYYQHSSFWRYEWSKHGTCSGLSPSQYLKTALAYQLPTPNIVGESYGGSIWKQDLQDALGYDVVLMCSSGRYLYEVRSCLTIAGIQMDCPSSEMQQSNCYSNTLYLASFPSDR